MATATPPRSTWASPRRRFHHDAHPTAPTGLAAVYRRRRPTTTPLYPIVQHHLESFLARAAEADPWGEGVAGWVEEDFRAYLRCGILAHGFARIRCDDCAAERLVAFSCKGRGVCPSCNARRMVEVAAHLNDHVLPPLPIRQWVLSVPKRIRPFFHHDPALAGAVLRILLRAIRTTLRRDSPGAGPDAQIGAVSFLHRFGAALNPHFHFHLVVLDGVFTEVDGEVRFHEATHFSADDAETFASVLRRRILHLFQRRGLLDEHTVDDMLTWQGTGGFSLDASVRIHGSDRAGRERLIRYCARPPFPLRCPDCGSDMRILAFLTDPRGCRRHLDLPDTAPRLAPARAPPQAALELESDYVAAVDPRPADDFDQTPAFDPAEPEPLPELDLDQTRGA
jgi:hypothetical protein